MPPKWSDHDALLVTFKDLTPPPPHAPCTGSSKRDPRFSHRSIKDMFKKSLSSAGKKAGEGAVVGKSKEVESVLVKRTGVAVDGIGEEGRPERPGKEEVGKVAQPSSEAGQKGSVAEERDSVALYKRPSLPTTTPDRGLEGLGRGATSKGSMAGSREEGTLVEEKRVAGDSSGKEEGCTCPDGEPSGSCRQCLDQKSCSLQTENVTQGAELVKGEEPSRRASSQKRPASKEASAVSQAGTKKQKQIDGFFKKA